jgi:hypothetical protein
MGATNLKTPVLNHSVIKISLDVKWYIQLTPTSLFIGRSRPLSQHVLPSTLWGPPPPPPPSNICVLQLFSHELHNTVMNPNIYPESIRMFVCPVTYFTAAFPACFKKKRCTSKIDSCTLKTWACFFFTSFASYWYTYMDYTDSACVVLS